MAAQRGVTLVEVVIAAAISVALGWVLIGLVHALVAAASHLDARTDGRSALDRLAERLQSDAAGAWSVFVPNADLFGASNADGHELDFASENASHRIARWAYLYDAAASQVTAYAFTTGGAPVAGERFTGLSAFACEAHDVTDLRLPSSDVYDPLFATIGVTPVDFDYGWSPLQAVGGNRLVRVALEAPGGGETLLLAGATAPSSFTVVVPYTPPPPAPTP